MAGLYPWLQSLSHGLMAGAAEQNLLTDGDESSSSTSIADDVAAYHELSQVLGPPVTVSAATPTPNTVAYSRLSELLGPLITVVEPASSDSTLEDAGHALNQATLQMFNSIMQEHQTRAELREASSADFCRICRDTASSENFLSPCHCKGTLGNVHLTCLQRWLAESDTSFCELCGYQYTTVRIPKYSITTAMVMWCSHFSSRDLVFDALAFCAFTPVALLGTYLGMVASDSLEFYEDSGPVYARTLTLGVVSLMAAIDFAYIGWILIRLQHHFHQWYSWWRRNCVVNIVLPEEKNALPTTKTSDEKK